MRPMRGWLWRASIVYQRPARKASNQALNHGIGINRNADVAEIASAIPRGNVHAAAKRYGVAMSTAFGIAKLARFEVVTQEQVQAG
jgi:hypothetical protein